MYIFLFSIQTYTDTNIFTMDNKRFDINRFTQDCYNNPKINNILNNPDTLRYIMVKILSTVTRKIPGDEYQVNINTFEDLMLWCKYNIYTDDSIYDLIIDYANATADQDIKRTEKLLYKIHDYNGPIYVTDVPCIPPHHLILLLDIPCINKYKFIVFSSWLHQYVLIPKSEEFSMFYLECVKIMIAKICPQQWNYLSDTVDISYSIIDILWDVKLDPILFKMVYDNFVEGSNKTEIVKRIIKNNRRMDPFHVELFSKSIEITIGTNN